MLGRFPTGSLGFGENAKTGAASVSHWHAGSWDNKEWMQCPGRVGRVGKEKEGSPGKLEPWETPKT